MNKELLVSEENYGKVFSLNKTDEMHRIELVSETYDFITQKQLKSLGLTPGARCIDIGSGTGSIATWLSNQPELATGEVIAMDLFVEILQERIKPSHNLSVVQNDITTNDKNLGKFDLINIRFVLMHLRERKEILKKLASWLKPGGWLVVSDIIDQTTERSDNFLYKQTMSTMWNVLINTLGTDKEWSGSLKHRFEALNLINIRNEIYLPPIGKNTPMSEFWYLTWKDLHQSLIEDGDLQPELLIQAENELMNGTITDFSPGMLTCMGQKRLIAEI